MCLQRTADKLSGALSASQAQARQADSEVKELEKAFQILQDEVRALSSIGIGRLSAQIVHGGACHGPRVRRVVTQTTRRMPFEGLLFKSSKHGRACSGLPGREVFSGNKS